MTSYPQTQLKYKIRCNFKIFTILESPKVELCQSGQSFIVTASAMKLFNKRRRCNRHFMKCWGPGNLNLIAWKLPLNKPAIVFELFLELHDFRTLKDSYMKPLPAQVAVQRNYRKSFPLFYFLYHYFDLHLMWNRLRY